MDAKYCYELLELEPGASQEQVKAAFRELAKQWHPDRVAHNSKLQTIAQEELKKINAAYEFLKSYKPNSYFYSASTEQQAQEEKKQREDKEARQQKHAAEQDVRRRAEEALIREQQSRKEEEQLREIEEEELRFQERWSRMVTDQRTTFTGRQVDFSVLGEEDTADLSDIEFCYHCGVELMQAASFCPVCRKAL